ncbi:probable extracellular solute-binding protein, family 1 [Crocosphaera subtropica ATCC 51142]|uniref:Probable extracellular solute-binding protein, family 1 n=1 Tax=Crocosphaera subtropica (strain ATCC 51142 / BH68) TaxID=43989 RepID=B1WZ02_CROS5|nr:sugar ABC transporter substrate-binding protein [Crocosphaera subtropica]ACB52766.1 probable extracellular solute-binding protein, family 1 [Crocosphaera subtropica ATCC 51142]
MSKLIDFSKVALWGLLGLILSFLISCNGGQSPTADQELEFWTMQLQPQFTPYFTELIKQFEQDHEGIKIRWVDIPWEAMESKILTAVSANTAPDVVNLNPNFASKLASRNAWLNLTENNYLTPEEKQEYLPNIWDAGTVNNISFGLPWYLTTQITIYNQELLKQAGIEKAPKTFQELAEMAATLKEKTGKYAMFFTFVPGDSGEVLESLVQMGVTLFDENGKAAFNSREGLEAFNYWVNLYQQELLPPEVLTQGHRHAIDLYQSGEIALLSTGAESFPVIIKNAPTIAEVSAASPQITGETGKRNVAVMNLVIPKSTDKPQEAIEFATFVTNTENQLKFAKEANVLPSTIQAIETYINEQENSTEATPLSQAIAISAKQLKEAEVLVPPQDNINQLQKIIYENLQAAMLNEKTVEQALQDAAEAWNNLNNNA